MNIARYAGIRLTVGVVQTAAVVGCVFVVASALPGDAAVAIAADDPDPDRIAALRQNLGLDRPLLTQFGDWAGGLLQGDLGTSAGSGRPVTAILAIGVVAATHRGRRLDRTITGTTVALYAAPEFAVAIVLISVFAVGLGWFPPTAVGAGDSLLDQPELLVLPVVVLMVRPVCSLSRLVRASMATTLDSEYVEHSLRLGISMRRVIWRHALPGSLTPATQHVARIADWMLGGVVIVEAVFAIGGLGEVLVDAVSSRDLPLLMGVVCLFAVITVVVNTVADIVAYQLNPAAGDAL
jgi:peptide/nickel transport system permease protein